MWDHKYGMRQQRWMVWCVRHTKTMSKLYYMTKKNLVFKNYHTVGFIPFNVKWKITQ